MKQTYQFLFALAAVLFLAANASAVTFEFYDVAAGGEAAATIDFSVSGNTLNATINNTSSTTLVDGTDANAPGITGFGFDLSASGEYTWTMVADDGSGNSVTIGYSGGTYDWVVTEDYSFNSSSPSFEFDYTPNTFGSVDGALYNPDAIGSSALPGGSNDVWFTTAVFSITFKDGISGDVTDALVRMQNVGLDGDGSTKTPGVPVPEPATMLLLGTGLLGLAVTGRKKFKK